MHFPSHASTRKTPTSVPRASTGRGDPRGSGTHLRPPAGARKRVLLVEDVEAERALLATVLRDADYDVTAVGDGLEALEQLERVPRGWFSLVVVDHLLPRLKGLEVLSRASSRARFIVVTGVRDPALRASAMSLGAEDVLTKPVDVLGLLALARYVTGED